MQGHTEALVFLRMLTYADVCCRIQGYTEALVFLRMLPYADVCCRIQGYSEALVFLPISSFISGHAENHREVLEETPYAANTKRSAAVEAALGSLGIRRNESLLCCFNGLYKLDPHAWHTWMDILRNLSFSSEPTCSERTCSTSNWRLWLSREPPQAYAALCRESEARGVACDRLLFTHHVPFHLHIQVLVLLCMCPHTAMYVSS